MAKYVVQYQNGGFAVGRHAYAHPCFQRHHHFIRYTDELGKARVFGSVSAARNSDAARLGGNLVQVEISIVGAS